MNILMLLAFISMTSTFAQVRAHLVDPDMGSPDGKIQVTTARDNKSSMISKADRDAIYMKYPKALSNMKNWDEVDKDIFWSDLKTYPIEKLEKKYSKIPKQVLLKMKDETK